MTHEALLARFELAAAAERNGKDDESRLEGRRDRLALEREIMAAGITPIEVGQNITHCTDTFMSLSDVMSRCPRGSQEHIEAADDRRFYQSAGYGLRDLQRKLLNAQGVMS